MVAPMGSISNWQMTDKIVEKLQAYFQTHQEVLFALVFGSVAKGTAHALSDIDVAVMLDPSFKDTSPYGYQATLTADLMQVLKRNEVDVVILNRTHIALRYQVLRYGRFIHVRDEQEHIQFQIDTINRHEDFKRMYQVHQDAFQKPRSYFS